MALALRLLFLVLAVGACCADESIVTTPQGQVRGLVTDMAREFYNIRYAAAPTGSLRFQPPQPAGNWSGIYDATTFGYGCPQICDLPPGCCPVGGTSEDCLNLEVFTPRLWALDTPRPVMVFFYGGNYRQGASQTPLYNGFFLANNSKTVVVVPNYRLGALAYLKNKHLEGNLGIQDQTAVLRWIQQNIASFGGDPNQVTIFGQSAGASSVACHMLSPPSTGLFHAAIMESNPITLWLKTPEQIEALSTEFARKVGCQLANTSCFLALPVEQILKAQEEVAVELINPVAPMQIFMPWQPTADGKYITGQPMLKFPAGDYNRVPFLLGNVESEGLLFIYAAFPHPLPPKDYRAILDAIFLDKGKDVFDMYPVYPEAPDARPQFSILATDYVWACPFRNISRTMSALAPLYLYHFDHAMSFDPWGPLFQMCAGQVCHGSELPFLFNSVSLTPVFGLNYKFTPAEEALAVQLSSQFGNFATSFDPNRGANPGSPSIQQWPAYTATNDIRWLYQTPVSTTQTGYRARQCNFFDSQIGYYHGNELVEKVVQFAEVLRQQN